MAESRWTWADGHDAGKRYITAVLDGMPGSPVRLEIDLGAAPLADRKSWALGFAAGAQMAAVSSPPMLGAEEQSSGDGS